MAKMSSKHSYSQKVGVLFQGQNRLETNFYLLGVK